MPGISDHFETGPRRSFRAAADRVVQGPRRALARWQMSKYTADDGTILHFREKGRGPPVLFLHGYLLDSRSWAPQLDALSDRFHVLAPDFRGFGASPLGQEVQTTEMERLARDVFSLMDSQGFSSVPVVGLSMGGYVAMEMARLAPNRVASLVLADTRMTADDDTAKRKRLELAAQIRQRGTGAIAGTTARSFLSANPSPKMMGFVERQIRQTPDEGAIAGAYGLTERSDHQETLATYSGPALVLVGAEDQRSPPSHAREIARLLGAQMKELPDAGHVSNVEQPSAFNDVILAFLTGQ